jgi:PAS domain S-box-containing protein
LNYQKAVFIHKSAACIVLQISFFYLSKARQSADFNYAAKPHSLSLGIYMGINSISQDQSGAGPLVNVPDRIDSLDITERSLVEEELREALAVLQKSQSIAHLGHWKLDLVMNIFTASDEGLRIFGFPIGSKPKFEEVSACILAEDRMHVSATLQKALQTHEKYSVEMRIRRKDDGEIRHILSIAEVICDSVNKPVNIIGTNQDITERKLVEIHRDQLFQFAKALNEISESIISKDNATDILRNSNRILGETLKVDRALIYDVSFENNRITSLSEWLRLEHPDIKSTMDLFTSLDMFHVANKHIKSTRHHLVSYSEAVNEHFQLDGSGKILHNDLKVKSLIWYPFAFEEKGYHVFALNQILEPRIWTPEEIGFIESVANLINLAFINIQLLQERKFADEELQEREARHRTIIDTALDGFVLLDNDGKLIDVNASYCRMSGYRAQELLTMHLNQLEKNDVNNDIGNRIQKEIADGHDRFQTQHRRKDGTVFDVEINAQSRPSEAGQLAVFIRDITKSNQIEKELREALLEAESGDRLKTAFMNNISHEIRTPLNGIVGFSDLIIQPNLTEEEKETFSTQIRRSSDRLIKTVNNYMDVSMITSGDLEVHLSPFDLDNALQQLFEQVEPLCKEKNLKLTLVVPEKLYKTILNSDHELLMKSLIHLLENAITFTRHGEISFGYMLKAGFAEFFVTDTGLGISKEAQVRIFENFVQEEVSLTRAHEGNGLGLAITKNVIKLLGGDIRVESEKGVGSSFFFYIPFDGADRMIESMELEKKRISLSNNPVLLIAEDDESNRLYLKKFFPADSITIHFANNGLEAVDLCIEHPEISLVLMDLKMPVMDGFQATRTIRTFRKDLPIIAITAFAMSTDKAKAMEAGCDDYLSKPVTRALLLSRIRDYGMKI